MGFDFFFDLCIYYITLRWLKGDSKITLRLLQDDI